MDGGVFRVCNNCARLGTPARIQRPLGSKGATSSGASTFPSVQRMPQSKSLNNPPTSPAFAYSDEEMILRDDYSKVIKDARETLGITQEDLGRKINEKPSMISHLETGSMKPDDLLARKLEHFLKIQLFIPEDETGSGP